MDLNAVFKMIPRLEQGAAALGEWLKCLWQEQKRQRLVLERVHGVVSEKDTDNYPPRSLSSSPLIVEGQTDTQAVIDFVEGSGYVPSDGSIANIGDEPFRVQVRTLNGSSAFLTVLPGTSYEVRYFVKGAIVEPLASGATVAYQFYLL
jgi:hypothetical protein